MAENIPRFEGEIVNLGGTDYTVPPLSLRQVKRLATQLDKLDPDVKGVPAAEQIDATIEVMHAALSRNYPDLTREQLEDLIDLGNMTAIIKAAMRTSGLERRAVEGKQ